MDKLPPEIIGQICGWLNSIDIYCLLLAIGWNDYCCTIVARSFSDYTGIRIAKKDTRFILGEFCRLGPNVRRFRLSNNGTRIEMCAVPFSRYIQWMQPMSRGNGMITGCGRLHGIENILWRRRLGGYKALGFTGKIRECTCMFCVPLRVRVHSSVG